MKQLYFELGRGEPKAEACGWPSFNSCGPARRCAIPLLGGIRIER